MNVLACAYEKCIYFDSYDSFMKELRRREGETIRITSNTKEIQFINNEENENVYLNIDKTIYPIAHNAYTSIKGRISIYGSGLLKLPAALLVKVLNERIKTVESVKIVIIDNKVRAIFAGSNAGYKELPSLDMVITLLTTIREKLGDFKFEFAQMSYDILHLKLLFPEKKRKVCTAYNIDEDFTPGILFTTSDTGYSSNKIYPILFNKGYMVLDKESVCIVHRGKNASINNIRTIIPMLFVRLRDSMSLAYKQINYIVQNPTLCTKEICKKLKLSKKDEKNILRKLERVSITNPNPLNAYDITKLFIEIAKEEKNPNKKNELEIIAGKAFYLDYSKIEKDFSI